MTRVSKVLAPWLLLLVFLTTAAPIFVPLLDSNVSFSDITTGNVSTSKHGFRPKYTNVAGSFTDEAGTVKTTVVQTDQANTYTTGAQTFTSATSFIAPASAAYAPTADASLGYDTTQDAWSIGGSGINGKITKAVYAYQSTSDTITASVVNTTETAFAGAITLPANFFNAANKCVRVGMGFLYTSSGAAPTLLLRIRLGGVGGTEVWSTAAASAGNSAAGVGIGGTALICGTAAAGASVNTVTSHLGGSGLPSSSQRTAQPVAVATNASKALTVTAQWGANTALNTITLSGLVVEEIN